jgi:short subunit dehydrogenase-like uncharacterized protein
VPIGAKQRLVDFGFDRGEVKLSQVKWGDLSTAVWSTGIGNIETYSVVSDDLLRTAKAGRYLGFIFKLPVLKQAAIRNITGGVSGPSDQKRLGRSSWLYAEVRDRHGAHAASRLRAPHAYTLTAQTAVEATARIASGAVGPGFQTAAKAFGPDFILEFEGVEREDL